MDHRRLHVWRLADQYALCTYRLVASLPPTHRYGIGEQLWRAALSIPANIVEGYARDSARQLLYHLNVAIGSLSESMYLLDIGTRLGVFPAGDAEATSALGSELRPRLRAFAGAVRMGRSRHTDREGARRAVLPD